MAGTPSRVNQSFREQLVSDDLNRIGRLYGKEKQDEAGFRCARGDFYDPETNTFDDLSAAGKAAQWRSVSGLSAPPSLDGIVASFDMNIGAGEASLAGASGTDESYFKVARWEAQTITWPLAGQPDAGNPRICLICATPVDTLTDAAARNILLDEVTRATAPQLVNKTSAPVATLSVVAGVAAAVPVPPAVPAGDIALFEVWVPAAVADSTSFFPLRRAWRRVEFPGSSQHGIVKGCELIWDPTMGAENGLRSGVHRVCIDGEVLTFQSSLGMLVPVDDSANTPGAAPANNDEAHYIYLCGGRHSPAYMLQGGTAPVPAVLVASTVAPDGLGYPTADLAIAAPATVFPRAACCYIGLRFYVKNTTNVVRAYCEGDWIHATTLHNFEQADVTVAAAVYTAIPMTTRPAVSTAMRVRITQVGAASGQVHISVTTAATEDIMVIGPTATFKEDTVDTVAVNNLYYDELVNPDSLVVRCKAFNMNVPRLSR